MSFRTAVTLTFLLFGTVVSYLAQPEILIDSVYRATLMPVGESRVSGSVIVYAAPDSWVAYSGTATALEVDLGHTSGCKKTALACRTFVHSGAGCGAVGDLDLTTEDGSLWSNKIYTSDSSGNGVFGGLLQSGRTNTLKGRPFVLHDSDGRIVTCGLLQPILHSFLGRSSVHTFSAEPEPLSNSTVHGKVVVVTVTEEKRSSPGQVCLVGYARGLEPNLDSARLGGRGADCSTTNGCGVHVHSGASCATTDVQGGHYYNDTHSKDPWLVVGYPLTTGDGDSYFAQCLDTGINFSDTSDKSMTISARVIEKNIYDGKPFIIHSNGGKRVACGILREEDILFTAVSGVSNLWGTEPFFTTVVLGLMAAVFIVSPWF